MAESTIITGQFVRISQVPASIGERIVAQMIDYAILFVYLMSTIYVLSNLYLNTWSGVSMFFLLAFIYLPMLCYSLLCEVFNNGQSVGKKLLNIRVVNADGSTPTLSAYLLRWLLYIVDVPLTGGLGLIVVLVTKNSQRLGDLAAGTMVIKEKNYKRISVSLDEFDHLSDHYKPVFPQAEDLSLEQVHVITKILQSNGKDRGKHIQELAAKVCRILSIKEPPAEGERFLQTLVRDYQYFAVQIV